MKNNFFAILFIAAFFSSCDTEVNTENYQQKVWSIESYEMANINQFISADGTYHEGFWGDKFIANCIINNTAKISACKDVVLKVTYYSKTNSIIGTEDYTVYEVFAPQSTNKIELEIKNYKDVAKIGWEAVSAVGITYQQ